MPKVLEFRMLCDEDDNFIRVYEALDNTPMSHLLEFIYHNLSYDSQEPASFFSSNKAWDELQEFAMDNPMCKAKIQDAVREKGERMILLFDKVNERAFYFEVSAVVAPQDGVKYPRLTLAEAETPDQYEPNSGDGGSIFEDAMGDFNEFDDEGSYDDEY